LGFSACVPRGLISDKLYFSMFCPPLEANRDGSVNCAPCGTRKVEAALLEHGFSRKDIIVAHPEHLEKAVGPGTKVVGITENDPLGIGPATSTFAGIFAGEAYMAIKFRELLNHRSIRKSKPKIIVGGPGAWQLEDEETREKLRVDCVVIGEGERTTPPLFERAMNGEELPGLVYGEVVPEEEIPTVKGATINGLVEIARGCGRGCDFCVPTLQRYRCLPLDHILKEVEVNLRDGKQPLLHAEDVLRYGAKGMKVNREAVINLFESVKNHPDVGNIGISHFTLSSVAAAPDVVEEISCILELDEERWISGQTGIETGSPDLMNRHMRGKCRPFRREEWPNVVLKAFEVLSENNWVPCSTLVLGLPRETERDIEITISLVEKLRSFKSFIVPLFFVSLGGLKSRAESFTVEMMTPRHTELLVECWQHNLMWAPEIIREWAQVNIRNTVIKHGLQFIFLHNIKRVRRLLELCRDEYEYNLPAMVSDARNGRIRSPSLPHAIYRLVG